ncbi:MAG: DMT family transporter [Pseudomonadota bacterium]
MSPLHRTAQVGAVVGLAIFWSLNWPMMKIGLTVVEPWTFRALLVVVGAVGCFAVALALGQSLAVPKAERIPLLWVGLFQGVLWNAFSGFGIALVEAGRAAVLAFTMPVWATLLAVLFLGEAVTARRLTGLAVGMAAMVLLLLPALDALNQAALGTLLMLAGAVSWAIATVIVKAANFTISPLSLAGWQFLIGGIPLTIAAFAIGKPSTLLDLDAQTGAVVAYSAIMPMVFCQAIFFAIVQRLPASIASMSTLMIPPMGVFFSAAILGEKVGVTEIASLALVVVAMLFILPGFSLRAIRRPQGASPPG